jgi:hypothetical protein
MNVPGMRERRLLLSADDPGRLTGFDSDKALREAGPRVRARRDDVELALVESLTPASIQAIVFIGPSVTGEDLKQTAAVLREILDIGPGADLVLPETGGDEVRGIGGSSYACPGCGQTDGTHRRGCPYARR